MTRTIPTPQIVITLWIDPMIMTTAVPVLLNVIFTSIDCAPRTLTLNVIPIDTHLDIIDTRWTLTGIDIYLHPSDTSLCDTILTPHRIDMGIIDIGPPPNTLRPLITIALLLIPIDIEIDIDVRIDRKIDVDLPLIHSESPAHMLPDQQSPDKLHSMVMMLHSHNLL